MFTTKNLFAIAGRHFLIALGVIAVTSVTVFLLSNQINSVSTKAAKDRRTAASLSERTAHFSTLKNEVALVGTNDETIKAAFIPANNILGFVAAIESLALKNGLTQSFHFSSPVAGTASTDIPVATVSFQNSMTADVSTLVNYLKDFEKLPYFTKIDGLTITGAGGDWKTSGTISFSATVATQAIQ